MAEPVPTVALGDEKRVERLALEEGHDADIPTEDQEASAKLASKSINVSQASETGKEVAGDGDSAKAENLPGKTPSSKSAEDQDPEKGESAQNQVSNDVADETESSSPNIVTWEGSSDPANPVNWSSKLKLANIGILSTITFITPLASSMFAPGVPQVMSDFHADNNLLASFVVSVYVLGYAIGPIFIAPLSEVYGRLPVYHTANVLFVILTVACAVSSNLNMLIAFRFFEGCAGSAPLTTGGGSIADMFIQEKRGGAMAAWAIGPLIGPVAGPVAGGFLCQAAGWRWVFWVIAIASGTVTIAAFFALRESYPPVLLERKAKQLRKETGNLDLRSKLDSGLSKKDFFKRAIVRPTKMLLFSPIVLALSTFMAVTYGYLYLLFTTITEVFEQNYGFSQGTVGLTYLGIGIGMLGGLMVFGMASDALVKKKSAKGEMKPEYRLPPMVPGGLCIPIGLFLYGWTADKHVFWIAPIIGTALVGVGLIAIFMSIQTYFIDAYTLYAASAVAGNTILRSLVGALLPLAGPSMYATLGLGWGNSLLAFIALAMCPMPIFFYKYGERIRKSPRFQLQL